MHGATKSKAVNLRNNEKLFFFLLVVSEVASSYGHYRVHITVQCSNTFYLILYFFVRTDQTDNIFKKNKFL